MVTTLQPAFTLEVEATGAIRSDGQFSEFLKQRGDRLIADLMIRAGFTSGAWSFRLLEGVRCAPNTPKIQVRRPEQNGVILWVKPGGNGSGVKGVLMVTRDKGVTPSQVYERLTNVAVVEQVSESAKEVKPAPKPVVEQVSEPAKEVKPAPKPTEPKPMPQPTPPITVENVLANVDKLKRLSELPTKLAEIRTRRAEIATKIETLQAETVQKIETLRLADDRYQIEEKNLLSLDLEALAMLVDSIK